MARVLVLSPHPDDEAIGCGGTICSHVAAGDEVRVVFLTSGEHGGHGMTAQQTRRVREAEAAAAARVFGVRRIEFWGEPDGAVDATDALVRRLAAWLLAWPPDYAYTTHCREAHPDHRAAARLLRSALAAAAIEACQGWLFEVWTPLQALDRIVDVSPWMDTKLRAVRMYASQCAVLRFDDAVAGLNRFRGEMHSWPGGDYAEVFEAMTK